MSINSQNIFDEKNYVAKNYRVIREFRQKTQDQVVKETGIKKQNVSFWEKLKGNPGKNFVDQLSEYFKIPSDVFFKKDLTIEYLQMNFPGQNPTSDQKADDNKEKMHSNEEVYRTIVEGHTEYLLVPREVLKETQLVSTEQIKRTWEELAEKNKELAAKNQELERKNIQLDFYQNQFAKLLENLELAPKPSKAKEV